MTSDRILVVNLGGIGDLVMSVPFLRGLRRSFPASRIELLAAKRSAGVLEGLPYFDRLRAIDSEALSVRQGIFRPIGAVSGLTQLTRIKSRRFDLAINLMPAGRDRLSMNMPAILAYIGASRLAGRNTGDRGGFYDISVYEPEVAERHEAELQSELLAAIGGQPDRRKRLEITVPSTGEMKAAGELLSGLGGPLVGVAPGAGRKTKVWPGARFAEVMDRLHEETGASYVTLGLHSDRKAAEGFVSSTKAPGVDLCGETSLRGLVAVVGRLNMLVANEAGPMFVAAAVGVPTVAVIGPGQTRRFVRDTESLHPVKGTADCAPCDKTDCDDLKCLKSISPAVVAGEALRLLKDTAVKE